MSCACVSYCRECHARVVVILMAPDDKPTPIDAKPTEDGNVRLTDKRAFPMSEEERLSYRGPRYTSHLSTCPGRG